MEKQNHDANLVHRACGITRKNEGTYDLRRIQLNMAPGDVLVAINYYPCAEETIDVTGTAVAAGVRAFEQARTRPAGKRRGRAF